MDRGHANAMATVVYNDGNVEKKALFQEGKERLITLSNNMSVLKNMGIPIIEGKLIKNSYVMPFSEGVLANVYLQSLVREDIDLFLEKMDYFRSLILKSSKQIGMVKSLAPYMKKVFRYDAYYCFWVKGEFYFFDQEFVVEEYPVYAIIYRAIATIYQGQPDIETIYPMRNLWERYDLLVNGKN